MSLEVLGLPADADEAAVRARFKELAKERHPDAGGTVEQFQALSAERDAALAEVRLTANFDRVRSALRDVREAARGTPCPRCDGTGASLTRTVGFRTFTTPCRLCRGKGKL